ncbi:single-stranded DNA-binding protein [Motilimonas pumila]|nr:single-stranded DNA-binding protein [Motilimonas pumila]
MNKVILEGFVGDIPTVRTAQSTQGEVTSFSLATHDFNDTQWHNIVCFKQAASYAKKFQKGTRVLLEGFLKTTKWHDQQGNPRSTTEVVATRLTNLNAAHAQSNGGNTNAGNQPAEPNHGTASPLPHSASAQYGSANQQPPNFRG